MFISNDNHDAAIWEHDALVGNRSERQRLIAQGEDKTDRLARADAQLVAAYVCWGQTNAAATYYRAQAERTGNALAGLQEKIQTAKRYIETAVVEHDGCREGKRDFLTGTGLFEPYELDDIVDPYVDATAEVRVVMTVEIGVQARQSQIDNGDYDVEVHDEQIESAIRSYLNAHGVDDYDITDLEEA